MTLARPADLTRGPAEMDSWDDVFKNDADCTQPTVCVPRDIFDIARDDIVTAARRNGFMRVLWLKDAANVHFCRYV